MNTPIGFGCPKFDFAIYISNQPNMIEYQNLDTVLSLTQGEIYSIGQACGNGWRKIFNVYAKLLFALNNNDFNYCKSSDTWQKYRDDYLLQNNYRTALLFNPPVLNSNLEILHIICGRTYAKELINSGKLLAQLIWLDDEFAIDKKNKLIICPYLDYRQLSNIKIERLSKMLTELKA